MKKNREDRLRGTLLGLAVGDALGAAVEFAAPGTFAPVTGYRAGGPHGLGPGEWTDDTSMALALADSIGATGWDLNDQARRYLAWYEQGRYSVNGRCFDIGIQTRSALIAFKHSGNARASGNPAEKASGNGSLMRLAPVPIAYANLYPEQAEQLAERAEESSLPTHPSPICRSACRYLAVVLAALAHGESRETVLSPTWPVLERIGPLHPAVAAVAAGSFRAKEPPAIRGSGYVVHSLEAALWAFHSAPHFREAVLRAVNLGDDADTTGAVCGQLAGAFWGESGIPAEWREQLARPDLLEAALSSILAPVPAPAPTPPWTYWVIPGRFLAGCFPGALEAEEEERRLEQLLAAGIRVFINLMEETETNHAGVPFSPYGERAAAVAGRRGHEIECLRFPIRDLNVPTRAEMEQILQAIDAALETGPVYLHCWGGVGRTGTVVSCWLLERKLATPENVLHYLAELRKMDRHRGRRASPETRVQLEFVRGWAREPAE